MTARSQPARLLAAALLLASAAGTARAQGALVPAAVGLGEPLLVTHARDRTGRIFVAEKGGRIVVVGAGAPPSVFLDLTPRVRSAGDEQGLIGLAFHPGYPANGRFFVHYTREPDGATRISELALQGGGVAERILLEIPQLPFINHNGGSIEFGPDGFLYVGLGDGGSANDPDNNAQNLESLFGKILRIDVNGAQPYAIPGSNPFVGSPGRDEIWAYGLRNPFRFGFDRDTGLLFAGDVGQGAREEIDVIEPGRNYGWRVLEGTRCNAGAFGGDPTLCTSPQFTAPIAEYGHGNAGALCSSLATTDPRQRCSVTGGNVYRGTAGSLPYGAYVYGDFCTGEIFLLQDGSCRTLLDTDRFISSFGEDEMGEIYVADLAGGRVDRLVEPSARSFASGVFVAAANVDGAAGPEIVTGAGPGGGPHVRTFGADGRALAQGFFAYDPAFGGGISVAACDFDADGRAEVVTGAGPGGGPQVQVFDVAPNGQPTGLLATFLAYDPAFGGGIEVACGDVNGDGRPDVVTGAGAGGGPHVRVFDLAPTGVRPLAGFFAYDPTFRGGIHVAAGDLDGGGRASIVTGTGAGGGPQVRVFQMAPNGVVTSPVSFVAYAAGFGGGVYVAAGDVTGDGRAEVVTGAGQGGGPHVRTFAVAGAAVTPLSSFQAFQPFARSGVRVAAAGGQVVSGMGPGATALVKRHAASGAAIGAGFRAY